MSQIILVKNNKGGVGKSWITLQLAAYKAMLGMRTCILTSDPQNNILTFSGRRIKEINYLSDLLQDNKKSLFELRENLFFIPVKAAQLRVDEIELFFNFIKLLKKKFEFIVIDGNPILSLDDEFTTVADSIIIPTFLDSVTTESVHNMITNLNKNRIKAVIPNRFGRTALEKQYLENLGKILSRAGIYLAFPISQSSIISKLIESGKTIWESKSKKIDYLKNIFIEVWKVIEDE